MVNVNVYNVVIVHHVHTLVNVYNVVYVYVVNVYNVYVYPDVNVYHVVKVYHVYNVVNVYLQPDNTSSSFNNCKCRLMSLDTYFGVLCNPLNTTNCTLRTFKLFDNNNESI